MSLSTFVTTIILIKWYAVSMLIASGFLWFVNIRDRYRITKNKNLWAYFGFVFVGLLLSVYFIDGWRPPNFWP